MRAMGKQNFICIGCHWFGYRPWQHLALSLHLRQQWRRGLFGCIYHRFNNCWNPVGLVLTWVSIIACIWKGPETVGKVVYAAVIIPWIILIVLVIRGVTLDGAEIGLAYYLTPTFAKLLTGKVWLAAYTQVFFSMSIGFAIMIAYGSYLPKKTHLVTNAYIVAIGNSLTAFFGGLAVFGALGYLSSTTGTPIIELKASGPGLAFVVYPTIINQLPMLNTLFGIMFFVMLLTLGIDSAFSLVEAVTSDIRDKFGWSHKKCNLTTGCIGLGIGLVFISGAGLYWLDIVDYFMNFFGLALACLKMLDRLRLNLRKGLLGRQPDQ